eukprot:1022262-Rhodomonas_salina.1
MATPGEQSAENPQITKHFKLKRTERTVTHRVFVWRLERYDMEAYGQWMQGSSTDAYNDSAPAAEPESEDLFGFLGTPYWKTDVYKDREG